MHPATRDLGDDRRIPGPSGLLAPYNLSQDGAASSTQTPPLPHPETSLRHREGRIRHPRSQNTRPFLAPRPGGRPNRRDRRRSRYADEQRQWSTTAPGTAAPAGMNPYPALHTLSMLSEPRRRGGQPYRRTSISVHNRPHQEEEEAKTTGPAREKGSGQGHRQEATDKASPQQNARGDSGRQRDKPGGPPGVRTGQEQEPRAHGVQPAPCPGTAADS